MIKPRRGMMICSAIPSRPYQPKKINKRNKERSCLLFIYIYHTLKLLQVLPKSLNQAGSSFLLDILLVALFCFFGLDAVGIRGCEASVPVTLMAGEEANQAPTLPPYPERIMKAIETLNEENGSNESSISKYIESNYGDLPAEHSALLADHLNKMKESGELVFWKNNYTKPDQNAAPKRGRGRPPKPKVPLPPSTVLAPPRPRGRPPKDPNAPPKPPKAKVSAGSGRPRGRPRKIARPSGGLGAAPVAASGARPRGRPPKVTTAPLTQEVSVQQ